MKVGSRWGPEGRLEAVRADRALTGDRELPLEPSSAGEQELGNRELKEPELAKEPARRGMEGLRPSGDLLCLRTGQTAGCYLRGCREGFYSIIKWHDQHVNKYETIF